MYVGILKNFENKRKIVLIKRPTVTLYCSTCTGSVNENLDPTGNRQTFALSYIYLLSLFGGSRMVPGVTCSLEGQLWRRMDVGHL